MPLYTPLFPALEPPPHQCTQSSYTTIDGAARYSQLSYTVRLAAQHLDMSQMAAYKIDRPPSPTHSGFSKERSEKLQSEIEQAVRDRRAIPDHCSLLCVKYSGTKRPRTRESLPSEAAKVGPLVDTEEEWFAWEEAGLKSPPKLPSNPPPLRDRVIEWRSNLQEPSASPLTKSQPLAGPSQSQSQQSTLGFPVVKRSFIVKGKTKPRATNRNNSTLLRSKPQSQRQTELQQAVSSVPVNSVLRSDIMDTCDTSHSNADRNLIPVAASNDLYGEAPKHSSDLPSLSQHDFSLAPPSFPENLPTSTPKDKHQSAVDPSGLTLSLRPDPDAQHNAAVKSDTIPSRSNSDPQPLVMAGPNVADAPFESQFADSVECAMSRLPQPTPPSPPYTSPATPESRSHHSQIEKALPVSAPSNTRSESLDQSHVRPMTPPSESSPCKSPTAPNAPGQLIAPRTPTRRPLREEQDIYVPMKLTTPKPLTPKASGPISHPKCFLRSAPVPPTPDAAINGMSPTKCQTVGLSILPFSTSIPESASGPGAVPWTPERVGAALPTTYQLLATSRRSAPRPRAPSRKNSVKHMDVDEDAADPSPTKSERSFSQFSSPASSSDESDASGPIIYAPSNPPDSPTAGFGFTQDPGKFAPIGESTVLLTKEPLTGSSSPPTRLRVLSQSEGPSQTQRSTKGLGVKRRSGGMFSSQFDVDAQVNKLNAFLAHDVDIHKWDRAAGEVLVEGTDDEDGDDDDAVEALTFAMSPV